jgi:fatty-acyl-CoA synthase
MDISHWIAHRADWSPDRVAIHFEGADITYAAMADRIARLAGALRDGLGVGEGDRVAHLGLNSPELLDLLFACARIGAIIVPLNWRLTPAEHAYMMRDCGPMALLAEPEYQAHAAELAAQFPALKMVAYGSPAAPLPQGDWLGYEALVTAAEPVAPDAKRDLRAPVKIVYTSGTTGVPKGAVLSQEALFYNAVNGMAVFEMTAADHVLTALPMFHVGGMNIQTTPAMHAGATVTIHRRFDPERVLREFPASRPTLYLSVPAASLALLSHPGFADADLSSLRQVCTGSSTVPEAMIKPWHDRGIPVTQVYGMTESCPIAIALSVADARRKVGSTGKPVAHCEARIVDDGGRDLAPGESGEIWLRGPNIMSGYWGNEVATAEAFCDGWYRSGDVGHRDSDGFYYIDDRKRDMIVSGGENIYPAELENVLADCADIAEFAVIGRADDRWGEVPVVCVVPKPGVDLTRETVLGLFEGRLARYKQPRDVIFLTEPLPRTSLGKVQKFELRQRLLG